LTGEPDCRKNFQLKLVHSVKVAGEVEQIGCRQGIDRNTLELAKITGLLHDVGRFQQYAEYKTFNDSVSLNHGELGAAIIKRKRPLDGFDETEQKAVLRTVALHNLAVAPCGEDPEPDILLNLVRDADKLDIYRIFIHQNAGREMNWQVGTNGDISDGVHDDIQSNRPVALQHVKNYFDAIAMRLAWAFDINYDSTVQRIRERGYWNHMLSALPDTQKVQYLKEKLAEHLESRFAIHLP
jgi:hypothetical protein